jgi:ribosomal protein S18 acetylase RimI-like enzyme
MAKVQKEILPGLHSYLWAIAVDQSVQRRGIGKSLLKPGLDRADEQDTPVYLETHNEKNLPFYQALGFDLVREESLPGVGLKFWCMVRCPNSSRNKQS